RRCRGLRFAQLDGTVLATHLDRLAADHDLDCFRVELAVARRTRFLRHRISSLAPETRQTGGNHAAANAAVRFFSDRRKGNLAPGRALERGRRAAVGAPERSAEVAMAGEPEVLAERREIVVSLQEIERAGEAQAELVAVERDAFHALEDLR